MPSVRTIEGPETAKAFPAMAELRPHIASAEDFVERVNRLGDEGYRLVGSFEDGLEEPVAVAGFRTGHSLGWGHYLYVDDLSTRAEFRSRGHGGRLLRWLMAEAERLGCDSLHLDSGLARRDAHRFYLNSGLEITSHHFATRVAAGS